MGTEWTECAAVLDRWSGISDFKAANVRCIRLSSEPLVFRAYIPKHKHAHMWVQTCRKVARCRLLRTFRKGLRTADASVRFEQLFNSHAANAVSCVVHVFPP